MACPRPEKPGAQTEQWCYHNRMQPTEVRVRAAASANCAAQSGDLLRLGYTYWSPEKESKGTVEFSFGRLDLERELRLSPFPLLVKPDPKEQPRQP